MIEWPHGGSLEEIAQRARLLIAFADGQEEAGFVVSARRMRMVARDSLDLVERARAQEFVEIDDRTGQEVTTSA